MALVTCPDCGRQVSDTAPACPACGRPVAAPAVVQVQTTQGATGKFLDPMSNLRSCLGCFALLLLLGVGAAMLGFCGHAH